MSLNQQPEAKNIVKLFLIKIGMKCSLNGFAYLCHAADLVANDPNLIYDLCNNVYVQTAKYFDIENSNCIERSIRHAIDHLANSNGFSLLNKIFKTELYSKHDKPTSGEFIKLCAFNIYSLLYVSYRLIKLLKILE